jgi:hypothetical protein
MMIPLRAQPISLEETIGGLVGFLALDDDLRRLFGGIGIDDINPANKYIQISSNMI